MENTNRWLIINFKKVFIKKEEKKKSLMFYIFYKNYVKTFLRTPVNMTLN